MLSWPTSAPASWLERALSDADGIAAGRASEANSADRARPTWRHLYQQGLARLDDAAITRWFLEEASGGVWPAVLEEPVRDRAGRAFLSMVDRRTAGEPVQYVLGHWAFRKLDLMVDRRVLIPRPETEVVVDVALSEMARLEAVSPLVVDLGTGSGAIAFSIATERTGVEAWATDVSEDALAVASANLVGLGVQAVGRVQLVRGSWWKALPPDLRGTVDLVVANPPYVAETEVPGLPAEVSAWEPRGALIAGPNGLEALEEIVAEAPGWLAESAALVLEIAPHQADAVRALALGAGFSEVLVHPDLTGRDRALVARRA
jgi:release factor glutamine methyltransferase